MRDTFEFRGNQYLGHWNFESFCISVVSGLLNRADKEIHYTSLNIEDGVIVEDFGNADYREYRKQMSKGGDLLLFSDVKVVPVDILIPIEQ